MLGSRRLPAPGARNALVQLFIRLMAVARLRFLIELCGVFLAVWLGCAALIWWAESGTGGRLHTLGDAVYALLVTMTTSGDSAVQPQSLAGRLVMGFALLASKLLTALLCALAAAVLIEHKVKEDLGLKMHHLSGHIVILGWNLKGPQIVAALRSDPQTADTPVVIVADLDHKPLEDAALHFVKSAFPVRGDAPARACLGQARQVLVLAHYGEKQHADALSAVNCLVARQANPQARLVVELLDPAQRGYLEAAGADVVISLGDVGGTLLAEAAMGQTEAGELLARVGRARGATPAPR